MTNKYDKNRLFEMMNKLDANSINEDTINEKGRDKDSFYENRRIEKKKVLNETKLFGMINKLESKLKLNEGEAWASDGGYYSKPDHEITVSKDEAAYTKQITDKMYNDLFNGANDGIVKVDRHNDEVKRDVIKSMKESGIEFDYDSDDAGQDYYRLSNPNDIENAKEAFKVAVNSLYDKVDDSGREANNTENGGVYSDTRGQESAGGVYAK